MEEYMSRHFWEEEENEDFIEIEVDTEGVFNSDVDPSKLGEAMDRVMGRIHFALHRKMFYSSEN